MTMLKELLLLFITMMSLVASHPVGLKSCEKKRNEIRDIKTKFSFVLCNLKKAESVYVTHFFKNTSNAYRNLEPLDGITFPVGNTIDPDTLNSTCAIFDYLKNHLPTMIDNLTSNDTIKEAIIDNTVLFQFMFESLAGVMNECLDKDKLMECPRKPPTLKGFAMKTYALQILHTARNWTESYTRNMLP